MSTIVTAFEDYCQGKSINLRKRADGTYQMKTTRVAFREFKAIYEAGQRAANDVAFYALNQIWMGKARPDLIAHGALDAMGRFPRAVTTKESPGVS